MKNRRKYKREYKKIKGKIVLVKTEIKLKQLYCYFHHDYLPINRFPNETGYGTNQRTVCDACIQRKQEKRTRLRTGLTLKDRVFQHYDGYKCVDCGIEKEEVLTLHHIHNNGKECRIEACGVTYQYNRKVYWYWLIRNNYPPKHEQVVLCQNCHTIRGIVNNKYSRKRKLKTKKRVTKKKLTDEGILKEMFGIAEDEELV